MQTFPNHTLVRIVILLFTLMTSHSTLASPDDWKLVKDSDNIRAYTKSVQGTTNLAFRGTTTMRGNVSELVEIHRNVDSMSQWLHSCYEPVIVEDESPTSRIIHMKNSVPKIVTLFVNDRDLVLRQEIAENTPSHAYIKLTGTPDRLPANKGFVRVSSFEGHWEFTQLTPDAVQVEYEGVLDPSGRVPAAANNIFVVDTPFESLRKLRDYLYGSRINKN